MVIFRWRSTQRRCHQHTLHHLNELPAKQQESLLHDLFDPVDGARFTVGKIPIAATDFGIPEWYTYADEPQDESLPNFSIEKDLDYKMGKYSLP